MKTNTNYMPGELSAVFAAGALARRKGLSRQTNPHTTAYESATRGSSYTWLSGWWCEDAHQQHERAPVAADYVRGQP